MKKSLVILSVFAVGLSYAQKSTVNPTFSVEKEKVTNTSSPSGEREFSSKAEKQAFHMQAKPAKEITIISNDATFPKYVKTGDQKADAKSYADRKDAWVESNTEKYEKMNSFSKKNAESTRAKEKRNINHKN
jgi:hypothetical protein